MNRYLLKIILILLPVSGFCQIHKIDLSHASWTFRKLGDTKWLPAKVPGTVHTDLFNNGLIPDPFIGNNETKLQWIENEDWEYKTVFNISKNDLFFANSYIQFNGLDTYAGIFINDSLLLHTDNMFRKWEVNVKPFLKEGNNTLLIRFGSAVKKGKEAASKLPYTLPGDEKVFTRKAQYHYGWDWGPRFVTCGIYRNIELVFWDQAKINDVHYKQLLLNDTLATIEFNIGISSMDKKLMYINIALDDNKVLHDEETTEIPITKGKQVVKIIYTIKNPHLWWCNGLGDTYLYHFKIFLSDENILLDTTSLNIGLRTIELVQNKDILGSSFYFKLNGIPVFMKGANYIPPHSFLPQVTALGYEKIIDDAVFANMNMLRVWGGGVYADDAFYDACDKKGVLVWQDFMFACAMYPGDSQFVSNVTEEITQQVKHLRNHACIALWCGNNEIIEGWNNWGWQKQYNYSGADSTKIIHDYLDLFENKIKSIIAIHDPIRNYWSSSPSIGWGHAESLQQGDAHYWGVWWGNEPFKNYKNKVGRFMSEYGFQGMPAINTFKILMPGFANKFDSVAFKNHQKHPTGYQTINTYLQRHYKVPRGFDNYVYVSQLLQANGMQTAIESHRLAKPYCMGSLYWQLNDCWPVTSWSTVDFYHNYKAAHYRVKELFKDVIVSVIEQYDSVFVYVISDKRAMINGDLKIKLMNFSGSVYFENSYLKAVEKDIVRCCLKYNKKFLTGDSINLNIMVLHASFEYDHDVSSCNYYFVDPKDLTLQKPVITI
ncbi:MAG: glycoside hydrolase family 2 protein, partial [Bacteroidia bacterium]|nr:glycoside hydrolase family 2 protein [Bacteroidia bacterium]